MSGANSKKAAAQKARLEREAAERAASDRKKRLLMLGGAGGVVVLVIAIVLLAGSFKDKTNGSKKVDGVAGLAETQALTKGLQQNGTLLGNPDAPVTIHEFADVKCPACQQFEVNSQKENVDKLVRTGKANLRVHLVNIIDPNVGTDDGAKGRVAVNNLAASNQFFTMLSMNYFNQGDESTTWITENKYKDIAKVAGIDPSKVNFRETPGSRELAAEADKKFQGLGAQGTPAFFVQARGTSAYTAVDSSVGAIEAGVEKAAKNAKPAATR
ncbi:thioredoxin domain-containing protein [Patulibacter minatonensis]|uniref:thioredoxin domain-containing protein n=1 Tax=Patulibacter minatonensis TaxID=298163 RepID=UPI00047E8FCB|nr:thioredoxin domain-containing protein [Patulibacter minatonensis]